ncbi:MFS transporter [uncultured Arthrobacter sp.]|uniref:MFS transporter n=1 Tax=uncultured Arthrobacter sp. TaxID=114050 RepID=UPI00321740D5
MSLRSINAVIAPSLLADVGLSNSDLGLLSSAYFVSFASVQLPLGIWLDKYGPRRTESALLLVAALGAVVFATSTSLTGLWIGRALIGVGVSACLMGAFKAYRQWFAPEQQSQLASWMLVAGTAGALTATVPVSMALPLIGWRGVFWIIAALILLAAAAIFFLLRDVERRFAGERSQTGAASGNDGGYRSIFGSAYFWRMGFLGLVIHGIFLALQTLWAGPWMTTVLGKTPQQAGQILFALNFVLMLSYLALGWAGPRLVARGLNAHRLIGIGVGGIVLAMHQDLVLSGIVVAVVPLLAVIMILIVRRLVPLYRQGQELIDRTSRMLREQIIGANVIRGFVRQGHEIRRFDVVNKDLTQNNLRSALLVAGMMPLIMLVVNLSSVGVVWFGGHRIQSGEMRLGALTAFIAYILQILIAIMMAMYVFMTAPRAAACAERIQAVLDTAPEITDGPGSETPKGNTVEFRNVSFAYPGAEAPVLGGVSFTAVPGTVTAVIGATGSGKTTLLNLLPRFLAATGGHISIGGCDVRSLSLDTLRNLIAVVPQHSYLFSGTLAENLRMAAPAATDEELWRALGSAQAEEFVRMLPEGLEAPVSQGGTNFSGGQRQRLCIARALLREAPVYLFDDSFSALDYGTDYRLREAIGPLLRSATVLIVAERVATIVDAGLILVLEDGRLVAQGTHHQLMASSPSYREIAASQLVLEETL